MLERERERGRERERARAKDEQKKRVQYALYLKYLENPRVRTRDLFKVVGTLNNWKRMRSAQAVIDTAFNEKVLLGPYLYCNPGVRATLFLNEERRKGEEKAKESSTILDMEFLGFYSYIVFSRENKGNLHYAELTRPSFPAKVILEQPFTGEREFSTGNGTRKLVKDPIPHWDDFDWKVFHAMRNPRHSFLTAARELHVSWKVVKERFEEIVKECKVFMGFFPSGYSKYERLLLTFRTKYESQMREWLSKLDRSVYLFKVDDTLVVYLFTTHANEACLKFCQMEYTGIIRNFRVAFPVGPDDIPIVI